MTSSHGKRPLVSWAHRDGMSHSPSRFSVKQIIAVLRKHNASVRKAGLCCRHGISDATFYTRKATYGGMLVSEAKRLWALEGKNGKLKRLLADTTPGTAALRDLLGTH